MPDEGFLCRGACGPGWPSALKIVDVSGDLLIALAYFTIPFLMLLIRRRVSAMLSYSRLWALFAAFIVLCGMTHLATVLTYWWPLYWTDAWIKVATAIVSLLTGWELLRSTPKILKSVEGWRGTSRMLGDVLDRHDASSVPATHADVTT